MTVKKHKHTFAALWWHFGIYGRQDIHIHSCIDDNCDRVLVGEGRECGNRVLVKHERKTLGVGSWDKP